MTDKAQTDFWAVIELFGHQRIAGHVTEQVVGGQSFVRVDVPEHNSRPAFTKLFGAGAIYAITPTDEQVARLAVAEIRPQPVALYSLPTASGDRFLRHDENY